MGLRAKKGERRLERFLFFPVSCSLFSLDLGPLNARGNLCCLIRPSCLVCPDSAAIGASSEEGLVCVSGQCLPQLNILYLSYFPYLFPCGRY